MGQNNRRFYDKELPLNLELGIDIGIETLQIHEIN